MNKNKKDPARAENSRIEVSHRELIQTSWNRCEQYGLNHNSLPVHGSLSKGDLSVLLEEHLQLVNTTQKEVLPYYEHILANSKCMIALADRQGHVLNTWGNQRFSEHQPHGLIVGNQWQEANNGTNAIGTAIATGQAVQVGREEHFLRANRYMVGSAAPIFNTHKEMIGVLDISSDAYLPQDHTLGMVKLMTLTVENRLIFNAFANEHLLITFNTNIASLESPWSGLLAIDERGRIISANRRAEVMLAHDLALVNIEDLFGCKLRELRQQPDGMPLEVVAMGRFRMHILVRTPARMPMTAPDYRLDEKPERNAQQQNPAAELIAAQPIAKATQPLAKAMPQPRSEIDLPDDVVPLAELQHGDERVARMVLQASRIFEKDVPIVLHGETGCGKEVFIRSLHYHSSRRHHQLVALK